jgi:small multidrug resistance pump
MNAMLILFFAILSEIVGTTSLKYSEGFTRPGPSALVVVGYAAAFYLMSLSLKQIPLGTAYAIWSGVGTAGTALIGLWLWNETFDLPRLAGIALIIGGVVVLNMFGGSAH